MKLIDIIKANLDEKTIMDKYYGSNTKVKRPIYKNIIRNDSKGTCTFYWSGFRYYLYDFSRREMIGVWDIVQHYYNCSFKEALEHVARDFSIDTEYSVENLKKVDEHKVRVYEDIEKEVFTNSFNYRVRKFNNYDVMYWNQFGISGKTLMKYNVSIVEYIEMSKRADFSFNAVYQYKNDYESICYAFKVEDKVRFYRPNTKIRSNKWLGNTTSEDVFGLSQLNENADVIFIASGLKDLMCLNEMGFEGIAPMSEPCNLPLSVRSKFEEMKKQGKRIVYLYDTDTAGLKFATLYATINKFEAKWLPRQKGLPLKDVADFVQHFGKEKTREIIINMLNT